jgi:hypothetical protein
MKRPALPLSRMMTAVRNDLRRRSVSGYGATIRDMGYREHARCGQAADWTLSCELALVTWPPLRLARMRRERGPVGVVLPARSVVTKPREE